MVGSVPDGLVVEVVLVVLVVDVVALVIAVAVVVVVLEVVLIVVVVVAVVIVMVVVSVVFGVVDDLVWTTINAVTERTTKRVLGGNSIVKIWPKSSFSLRCIELELFDH